MRNELTALREVMGRAGVDAYVIPTEDFHGSEYVGDYFKCREYVSGFTGSAGTLVVTADFAGLWTDGRYFLQAEQQLSGSGIALCKIGQPGVPTVQQWLETHLISGQVLGFDGRTMNAATGTALEQALEKQGVSIRYELDLAEEIWPNRPALSSTAAWELSTTHAGKSRREKLADLQNDLQTAGADCYILTSLDDLAWLLNIRGNDVACCPVVLGYLMLDDRGVGLYADEQKFDGALRAALEADGVTLRPYGDIFADIRALPPGKTVLVDPGKVSFAIRRSIPAGVTVLEQANPTEIRKAKKTAAEQENMRQAHIKDGVALTRFMKWLKERVGKDPITEISAASKLEEFRAQQTHYLGASFDPIFGYGSNGAIIHYSATAESCRDIEPQGFLLSDTGGHYLEGSTDVTRTFALGPLTAEMRHHYTLVLRGNLHLAAAKFRAGCTGLSLDILARTPLWDEGLDYNHGTGHGVGYLLSVHEGPQNIRYRSTGKAAELEPGMITSDEPGLYLAGKYGIRLENLLLCVEKETGEYGTFLGFEVLTMCPFDLDAVEVEALTAREKALLNGYHKQVRETLAPYLTAEENTWLQKAARDI